MSIVAALDKVLFFNASSKYSVLRMKTEDSSVPTEARSPYRYHDHLIRFTAVGIELPQTDTVKIKMDGEWKDGKYGLQLQVDHWQEIVPPTLEGVRNYLASGLLKGIGEKTADAIIEKFGINALEILEHQPDRLLEIRGITKERLAEIKDAYAETSRMRVLMTLLAPFKVTPTTAQKIYQHFGPACADIVRQSPFNLCQVPGFGFKRIDAIVQKSGGDLRDPKRVHGALFYALEDARTKDGHLYLEAEALLKAAMQLLNERIPLPQMRVPMSQVEQELSAMIRQDEVVSNHGNVYLPKQFLQESETAQKAVELFLAKPTVVDIAQPLERVKNSLGLNLSKRQSEGVEMVFRHNLSIITGGPGTGKTTVLKTVIEVYRQLYPRQKIVLGAPTGKASRRMAEATGIDEAQTLHSILKLHGDSESKKDRERKPLEAGLLIVDETSMVDMWLIHQLFSRLRPGTKVLLVGDADQLESVGAGDVFHELIGSGVVPVTVLDEIFRQAQDIGENHPVQAVPTPQEVQPQEAAKTPNVNQQVVPPTQQTESVSDAMSLLQALSGGAAASEPDPVMSQKAQEISSETAEAAVTERAETAQTVKSVVVDMPAAASTEAAPKYSDDMTVDEILSLMTEEEAAELVVTTGVNKGWTMAQVSEQRPSSLKYYAYLCEDCGNIMKAAAMLLMGGSQQLKAS